MKKNIIDEVFVEGADVREVLRKYGNDPEVRNSEEYERLLDLAARMVRQRVRGL